MRIRTAARVAVIGAGPGGLTAAKHALEAGFDVTVFNASDDLLHAYDYPGAGYFRGRRVPSGLLIIAWGNRARFGTDHVHQRVAVFRNCGPPDHRAGQLGPVRH